MMMRRGVRGLQARVLRGRRDDAVLTSDDVTALASGGVAALPLFSADRLTYDGKVQVVSLAGGGGDAASFAYGWGLTYEPATDTFLMGGNIGYGKIGRIKNFTPKLTSIDAIEKADTDAGPADWTGGVWATTAGGGQHRMGDPFLAPDGRLICAYHNFYGGNRGYQFFVKSNTVIGTGTATVRHMIDAPIVPLGATDPNEYRKGGLTSNWAKPIPENCQAAFGGDMAVGNGVISILSETSCGPCLLVVNSADVGVLDPAPSTALMYYPIGPVVANSKPFNYDYWAALGFPAQGSNDPPWYPDTDLTTVTNPLFHGYSKYMQMVWPDNYRSVIFIYKHTDGGVSYLQNPGGNYVADGPAVLRVVCFDLLHLLEVKDGTRLPWDMRPHLVFDIHGLMSLPPTNTDAQMQPRGACLRKTGLPEGVNSQLFIRTGKHENNDTGEHAIHRFTVLDPA